MNPKLNIIDTTLGLTALRACLTHWDYVSYDIETTSVDNDALIIGFSVCGSLDEASYVVLQKWNPETKQLVSTDISNESIKFFLEQLARHPLIMHNAVFDCQHTERVYGISLIESVHTDTMALAHLLDENRSCGLKDLSVSIFGESSKQEQTEMKVSVTANGGQLTKKCYELYKADWQLIAKYGAKDAQLTLQLFYYLVSQLFEQGLDKFFYEDETMPLLKTVTYQLNTTGLKVNTDALQRLKGELEVECFEAENFIRTETASYVKDKYPGTNKSNGFNIGSNQQLSWLLFFRLPNYFNTLTKEGRNLCKALGLPLPYSLKGKRDFVNQVTELKGNDYRSFKADGTPAIKKIKDPWTYIACGKETLDKFKDKYKWVKRLLEYKKAQKLLKTYVSGIQDRMRYGIIHPNFLQIGTTSGRYSSKNPNFQNLPRDDKRVKSCIVSRPGKAFVGADYSQLEPRVFASFSGDERLLECFAQGYDFYSVIGAEAFEKYDCSLKKDEPNSFAEKYKDLRQIAKVIALSATYGTTAPKMSLGIHKSIEEAQAIIDSYFEKFPKVLKLMLDSHDEAKQFGRVTNLFGRPRRMPEALTIRELHGNASHESLPYDFRNLLNLAVNHRIQSTAASIVNRASIAFCRRIQKLGITDCNLVMNIHDELIAECKEEDADIVVQVLKEAMENTVELPGVKLIAEPIIGYTLAELKVV